MDEIILCYPVIYILFASFSNDGARKIALLMIVFLSIALVYKKKKRNCCYFIEIVGITTLNGILYGIHYIIHQDFYGYILLLLVFLVYSDRTMKENLKRRISKNKIVFLNFIFTLILTLDVVCGAGLQQSNEWGTSKPLLYGPYELPHSLAYQLIIMFMLTSIGYHKYKKNLFLVFMAMYAFFITWTGVRSAFLAFMVIAFYEYCSIRNPSNKAIILFGGVIVSFYVIFFTDFLTNNPILQKTIQALKQTSGITNGRTDFNSYLTYIYLNKMNILEKIFGIGIEKLRYYMSLRYTTALHAHNDVLNSLIGMGFIGFALYFKLFIGFCKNSKHWILMFIPIFILAFTNGLYMYIAFTPAIPIFILYFDVLGEAKKGVK